MRIWPGDPHPLGATWTGVGVNFAVFSAHATKVELCLFDSPDATKESARIELTEQTDQVWHAFLPDARPNQLYFQGRSIRGMKDVAWLEPNGKEIDDAAWNADFVRCLGMQLAGDAIEEVDEQGRPITGDTLPLLPNAHHDEVPFTLPALDEDEHPWLRLVDTTDANIGELPYKGGVRYPLQGRSVAVFRMTPPLRESSRTASTSERAAVEPAESPAPAEPVTTPEG